MSYPIKMILALVIGVAFLFLSHPSLDAGLNHLHNDVCHAGDHHADDNAPDESGQTHDCHIFCCYHGTIGLPEGLFILNGVNPTFQTLTVINDLTPDGPVDSIDYPPQRA